ncbi:hypothetical protein F4821DRAFT_239817 [Hypoxylon rubiginosum]|uniref:Uncharacterized protein n=1 Tax=Hypoxylon rubiginosum TaxID=110542 RepID=A0ACC0CZK0_9PEZI|nr:hypothetical protein F4821DRAFT_239817 [Hypoxylon rubiginosum]
MGSMGENDSAAIQEQPNMAESKVVEDDEMYQDVMSQFSFLNGYTNMVVGFQLAPDISQDTIVAAIRAGVDKLIAEVPWIGWQVIAVPGKPGTSDTLKPAPWPADSVNEIVRVKDCTGLMPSLAKLERAGVPIRMLDGKVLSPFPSLPEPHGIVGPVPIVAIQINFIEGGLMISFSANHIIIDGTGIAQLARLLAFVMNDAEIPADEVAQANRDRSRVVPLIPRGEPVKDYEHMRRPAGWKPQPPASPLIWSYFKLPYSGLATLMRSVGASSSSLQSPQLVSENDVMCALYWQRVTVVRLGKGFAPDTVSTFTRAIDARTAVGVPFTYLGHLVHFATTRFAMGQLASLPVLTVAQALRRDLNAVNTSWAVRSYATFLAREPDRSQLIYGGKRDPNIDVASTSSVIGMGDSREATSTVSNSWGPFLGTLRFVRRPNVAHLPASFQIYPVENGAIPLLTSLTEDDLNLLKKDPVWRQYTRFVG